MVESVKREEYGADYDVAILEQWKTCVEVANSNTEKRNNANGLFITINVALFAVVSFTWDYKSIFLSVIGIVVCILWLNLIRSYRQLSSVKYKIINDIEKMLPLAPFTNEWDQLKQEHKYIGLTTIETILPWVCIVLYALSFTIPLFKFVLQMLCPCIGGAA